MATHAPIHHVRPGADDIGRQPAGGAGEALLIESWGAWASLGHFPILDDAQWT